MSEVFTPSPAYRKKKMPLHSQMPSAMFSSKPQPLRVPVFKFSTYFNFWLLTNTSRCVSRYAYQEIEFPVMDGRNHLRGSSGLKIGHIFSGCVNAGNLKGPINDFNKAVHLGLLSWTRAFGKWADRTNVPAKLRTENKCPPTWPRGKCEHWHVHCQVCNQTCGASTQLFTSSFSSRLKWQRPW